MDMSFLYPLNKQDWKPCFSLQDDENIDKADKNETTIPISNHLYLQFGQIMDKSWLESLIENLVNIFIQIEVDLE